MIAAYQRSKFFKFNNFSLSYEINNNQTNRTFYVTH